MTVQSTPRNARFKALTLRMKLLLSYLAVIALSAAMLILIAQLTAPLFYQQHIEEMIATFGIENIPEMRRQLTSGFIGAFGSALVVASLVTLLLAFVVSFFVSRRIVEPVRRVSQASTRIAAGHYLERLPEGDHDELGELTRSFNRMAAALEATEARRRELIGTVAHELRTPLAGMRGYTEGLLDGVFVIEEAGPDIIHEIRRLERLVDDLSLVTRAEDRAIPIEIGSVSLNEVARAVSAQVARSFHRKGLTLDIHAPREVRVTADPDRVTQVLVNLLSNALRHTSEGGVTVTVEARGRWGMLSVQDTGEGIASKDLPHIFERFYRSDKSRARDAEESVGAGVGLTISKHLVEAMHGEIEVHSKRGIGTTFTVRFPGK